VAIAIAWPVARAGPSPPDLDLVEKVAELREAVGGRGAREDVVLVPIAVRAGAVGANAAAERQPLVEGLHLLIGDERNVPEVRIHAVRAVAHRAAVGGLHARQQAAGAIPEHTVVLRLVGETARRRQRNVA